MDLAHPVNCLTHGLQRAARVAARELEADLRPLGLTAPQFSLLTLLALMGPQAVGEAAARLGTDRTTMSRALDLLLAQGLVEPAPSEDARVHAFAASEAGRQKAAEARPLWEAHQARLRARLGSDAAALLETLRRL